MAAARFLARYTLFLDTFNSVAMAAGFHPVDSRARMARRFGSILIVIKLYDNDTSIIKTNKEFRNFWCKKHATSIQ